MNKARFGLMLWFVIVFLIGEVVCAAETLGMLRARLLDLADTALEDRAVDLQRFLEAHRDLSFTDLRAQLTDKYQNENSQDYIEITQAGGNPVYVSKVFSQHPLPPVPADDLDRRVYRTYRIGAEPFRIVSEQVELPAGAVIARIGRPMNQEINLLFSVRRSQIWYSSISLLIAVAGGYWTSRRAQVRS